MLSCEKVENSDRLLKLEVDLGDAQGMILAAFKDDFLEVLEIRGELPPGSPVK